MPRSNVARLAVAASLLAGVAACNVPSSDPSGASVDETVLALTPVPPGTRPILNNLSPQQRARLANAILDFITPEILDEHANGHDWHHPAVGEMFFIRHHDYLDQLEDYLRSHGFQDLLPMPMWDPGAPIPPEFLVADPLVTQEPLNATPNRPLPEQYRNLAELCRYPSASDLARDLESYHDGVHGAVGGAMAFISQSPGAPIFWPWHGLLDDVYHTYQSSCHGPPPCKAGFNCCGEWVTCNPEACPIVCGQLE